MVNKLNKIDNYFAVVMTLRTICERGDKVKKKKKSTQEGKPRPVHYGVLHKINETNGRLEFRPFRTSIFRFANAEDLFVYSESESVSFKAKVFNCGELFLICALPSALHILASNLFEDIQLVEREDESAHVHKRETPRKPAKPGQLAGIIRMKAENENIKLRDLPLEIFVLHDISTGGMAILVDDPGEFTVNNRVILVTIDAKNLARPIYGRVMSIRKMDGDLDQFKVGVKFD